MMKLYQRQQQLLVQKLFRPYSQTLFYNSAYFSTTSFYSYQRRSFAMPKYNFDDEKFEPNRFQVSVKTHKTNAEELINNLPIVEVDSDVARCIGVNELGLGHPVQYIQLNRRYESTPATCKWCGLRFRKVHQKHEHEHHH